MDKNYKVETKHSYWQIILTIGEYSDWKHEVLVICANSQEEAEFYFKEIANDLGYCISGRGWDVWDYKIEPLDVIYHSNYFRKKEEKEKIDIKEKLEKIEN